MIYIVGIGPGNSMDYLTLKAHSVLTNSDIGIYLGEMIGEEIKSLFKDGAELIIRNDLIEEDIKQLIKRNYQSNKTIALMMLGDPSIYSGQVGSQLCLLDYITWFKESNFNFEIVAGISSWAVLNTKLKIDMTPFFQNQNIFISSFERLIKMNAYNDININKILCTKPNLVLFQSFHEWANIKELLVKYYSIKTKIIFAYKLSWHDEKIIETTLEFAEKEIEIERIHKQVLLLVLS